MKRLTFKRQLKSQTTSKPESVELLELARQIESLELPSLSQAAKSRIASDVGFAYNPHRKTFVRGLAGAMAVLAITVLAFAQSAKPGSALYSTKEVSDKVRSTITHNVPLLGNPDDSPLHEANHINGSGESNRGSGHQGGTGSSNSASGNNNSGSSTSGRSRGSDDGSRSASGTSGSGGSGPSGSGSGLEQTSTGSTSSGSSGDSSSSSKDSGGSGSGRDSHKSEDN